MGSSSGNSLTHPPKRSVLLKDYLRDDLSSCSSNGFRSFPRRQCCTAVGFLVEKDLKVERKRRKKTVPGPRHMSVLQRASGAVIKAIKSLPLSQKGGVSGVICRSLSRKVVSRRIQFWRKATREDENKGVPRKRRSFGELMMLDEEQHKTTWLNAPSVTTTTSSSGCESWGDSEFTFASTGASSSSGSSNDNYLNLPAAFNQKIQQQLVAKEYWRNDEKEQLSPVSTLDCPFEDEEDIHKSHINSTSIILSFSQGSKHKHMHKRCHLLEPVVLEKRFARLELEDELPHNHYSRNNLRRACDKNHNIEKNARNLLNLVKRSITPNSLITKAESNLLFDFFKQSIGENKDNIDDSKKLKLCKVVEDWVHGKPQEQYLGWEVQGGRSVYIREMYKCEEWKKNSDQEIQQLGQDMANEIFTNLVNEFVLELRTSASH